MLPDRFACPSAANPARLGALCLCQSARRPSGPERNTLQVECEMKVIFFCAIRRYEQYGLGLVSAPRLGGFNFGRILFLDPPPRRARAYGATLLNYRGTQLRRRRSIVHWLLPSAPARPPGRYGLRFVAATAHAAVPKPESDTETRCRPFAEIVIVGVFY